jgi:hypothetical protein
VRLLLLTARMRRGPSGSSGSWTTMGATRAAPMLPMEAPPRYSTFALLPFRRCRTRIAVLLRKPGERGEDAPHVLIAVGVRPAAEIRHERVNDHEFRTCRGDRCSITSKSASVTPCSFSPFVTKGSVKMRSTSAPAVSSRGRMVSLSPSSAERMTTPAGAAQVCTRAIRHRCVSGHTGGEAEFERPCSTTL